MSKTLVAYGTRRSSPHRLMAIRAGRGATADAADVIAEVLRDKYALAVDVINIKEHKGTIDLDQYENIIIGSSIAYDRWTKEAKKFLQNNDFTGKRLAVFVSSSNAGEAAQKNDHEQYQEFKKKYIDDVLSECSRLPETFTTKAFGGRVRVFGMTFVNNWNREDIVIWAGELGEKFST